MIFGRFTITKGSCRTLSDMEPGSSNHSRQCIPNGREVILLTYEVLESSNLRSLARHAARQAAEYLLGAFRTPMEKEFKRDAHDIVTLHDKIAEETIVQCLKSEYPESVIIGEEGGTRGTGRVEWHIDPIDGTSNFARGIAFWCISIAAVIEERPVAGVVYDPVAHNLFQADLTGAWLGDVPIRVQASEREIGATIVSSFPNAKDTWLFGVSAFDAQARLIKNFQAVRNLGSGALNLAHVAAGWADSTMGFYTNSWDIAAGGFILQQAGGSFYGMEAGRLVEPYFMAPDYYAVGGPVEYTTLGQVVREWSGRYVASEVKVDA